MVRVAVFSFVVSLGMAGAGAAEETWTRLKGEEIREALSQRSLVYGDGDVQEFGADGSTVYEDGKRSTGRWSIRGDRYCSLWPPSDAWACYRVHRHARGLDLLFTAANGERVVGRYNDL